MIKAGLVTTIVFGVIIGIGLAAYLFGYRYNFSESMPRGIWQQTPFNGTLHHGDVIVACLPLTPASIRYVGPGRCPNGLRPVLKSVSAIDGDVVKIGPAGITVNDETLLNSAVLEHDSQGRPMNPWPAGTYPVYVDQVWLFSTWSPNSFDSRYVGPISVDTIIARAKPVWVWR
jgi:conjugative transfer signal peptidase TraF